MNPLLNKKIIIVDDHPIYREGLKSLLLTIDGIESVEITEDGESFIEKIRNNKYDIALVDIRMPNMNGIEAIKRAKVINSDIKFIILSSSDNSEYVELAIMAGASGYLLKASTLSEVKEAMQQVIDGHNYFSPSVLIELSNKLNHQIKNKNITPAKKVSLTARELEILNYITLGWSRKEIAEKLFISDRTVDKHKENLLTKTNSENLIKLVLFAIENNLIELKQEIE